MRLRHYSRRTEKAYVDWIRRCMLFHQKKHPATMGASDYLHVMDRGALGVRSPFDRL